MIDSWRRKLKSRVVIFWKLSRSVSSACDTELKVSGFLNIASLIASTSLQLIGSDCSDCPQHNTHTAALRRSKTRSSVLRKTQWAKLSTLAFSIACFIDYTDCEVWKRSYTLCIATKTLKITIERSLYPTIHLQIFPAIQLFLNLTFVATSSDVDRRRNCSLLFRNFSEMNFQLAWEILSIFRISSSENFNFP